MTESHFACAFSEGLLRTTRFLLSRGVAPTEAEDLAQGAWVKAWERRNQLRDEALLLSWVNAIALNQFRRNLQKTRRAEAYASGGHQPKVEQINEASIEIGQVLRGCSDEDRALLQSLLAGLENSEIARRCGVTQTAIRIRLFRARRRARAMVDAPAVAA